MTRLFRPCAGKFDPCCERGDARAGETVAEISDDDAFWEELGARLLADADKATDVGSAFHVLAQRAARRAVARSEEDRPAAIEMPSREAIDAAVRRIGVCPATVDRVQRGARALVRERRCPRTWRAIACCAPSCRSSWRSPLPSQAGNALIWKAP